MRRVPAALPSLRQSSRWFEFAAVPAVKNSLPRSVVAVVRAKPVDRDEHPRERSGHAEVV
jgi:hypothetical protein